MKHTFSRLLSFSFPLLLCLFIKPMMAQVQSNVVVQPDCIATFVFSGVGTQQINNLGAACVSWNVSYSSTGFSVISLAIEDAPDNAGVPGAWVTFAGTVGSGSNPNTSITSATTTFTGYYPWMRAHLSVATGTGKVTGTLYGFKNGSGGGNGGGGGGSSTIVTNFTTCQSGTNTISSLPINVTGTGNTQIVPASGSTVITICSIAVLGNANSNIGLVYGTGSNCGTGTTVLTGSSGGFQNAFGFALDQYNVTLPASNALCLSSSATSTIDGLVTFVQK